MFKLGSIQIKWLNACVSPRGGLRAITPTHHVVGVHGSEDDFDLVFILVFDDGLGLHNFAGTLF